MPKYDPKLLLPWGGESEPPPKTWFTGPPRVHIPNGISIGSAVLAQLTVMTNGHTDVDRPRYMCSNRPRYYALRLCDAAQPLCKPESTDTKAFSMQFVAKHL